MLVVLLLDVVVVVGRVVVVDVLVVVVGGLVVVVVVVGVVVVVVGVVVVVVVLVVVVVDVVVVDGGVVVVVVLGGVVIITVQPVPVTGVMGLPPVSNRLRTVSPMTAIASELATAPNVTLATLTTPVGPAVLTFWNVESLVSQLMPVQTFLLLVGVPENSEVLPPATETTVKTAPS